MLDSEQVAAPLRLVLFLAAEAVLPEPASS
jgi:hypothetical protein